MRGRVFSEKSSSLGGAFFIAVALIVVVLAVLALTGISDSQSQRQTEIARDAIVRAAVQCYALESAYPTGLGYLEENYGLSLDREKYVYHYRAIGSNMVPEVQVYLK